MIGERYRIPAGTALTVLTPMLHRDQGIWGADAESFNPEHTSADRLKALPPHAYTPFGTGRRACIGWQFAMQEAVLVLGMLLARFDLVDHLHYQLHTQTTPTVKPADMRIRVRRRANRPIDVPDGAAAPVVADTDVAEAPGRTPVAANAHGTALSVLFGSNLGTAEGLATRLAQEGSERLYAVTLGALDDHVGSLPAGGAVIVVCASYNGAPPDNAVAFAGWLGDPGTAKDACEGVAYAVFGCGNSEWAATYQAVPENLDAVLEGHGARRVHRRGEGDARGDFDAAYRDWHEDLWTDLAAAFDLSTDVGVPTASGPRLSISVVNRQVTNPVIMSYQAHPALVRTNRELLGASSGRSTRHVEVALPAGVTYRAGDHLGVLPRNNVDTIRRAMRRFALDAGSYVTIVPNRGSHTHLPIDDPAPLLGVLGSCVELQDAATRDNIEVMARYTDDAGQRAGLEGLVGKDENAQARYRDQVWNLIAQKASIFVCGNANTMAPAVRAALVDIYRANSGGSADDGEAWLADLRATDRFVEDIWGG